MTPKSFRTVHFLHRQDAVDLYRCIENRRVYARIAGPSNTTVRWLTTSPCGSGFEPDSPLKAGLRIVIVDAYVRTLFTEDVQTEGPDQDSLAKKMAPFSWEAEKALASDWAEKKHLIPHEQWRRTLASLRDQHSPSDDLDNWCYCSTKTVKRNTATVEDPLGRRLYVECCELEHSQCSLRWKVYTLKKDPLMPLEICGYEWVSGKEETK